MTEHEDKTVNRRRLLRRAGTVAAGVAGSTVVGAAIAAPAQAAPGDPVVQGANNAAGATSTSLTSTAAGATLQLGNTNTTTAGDGTVLARPALRLTPSGEVLHGDSLGGSIGMDTYGNIQVVSEFGGGKYLEYVHTTGNSNQIVSIVPQRLVDTRSAGSRASILNASSTTLDSSGRLRDGQTIHIDLSEFSYFADALFGNLTVTTAVASGFVQIFPYGSPRPANFSTINYLPNQVISNSFMSGVGYDDEYTDVISVYAARTTHIIIDVVAFVIGVGAVNPGILPFSAGAAARGAESPEQRKAKRAAAAKQQSPSWK
ncbi:hypothetical protein JNW91_24055 [Micromonospora sp. STR1_7]|uniref:Uncharacterized protein n=1 Tax=Micromonospora parastrephiae TaxID=2806101 RepID=A0ABS1XZE0_9ACTN|nr:hypothetical protein [Micromonospora parastrephiae]MBM0234626.1 hypothetical protein [Micromonospora parastrephiae]